MQISRGSWYSQSQCQRRDAGSGPAHGQAEATELSGSTGPLVARTDLASIRFVRPLKDGEVVCHKCDTPACVNPAHLFAGTQADNLRDCVGKGRKETRERSVLYRGAMTDEIALDIRSRRKAGESNRSIASSYGISEGYCSTVARGIHWPVAV